MGIKLKLEKHDQWFEAHKFFHNRKSGRTVFHMIFDSYNPEHCVVFRGTYMRGSNKVIYYGDLFEFACEHGEQFGANESEFLKNHPEMKHMGGFKFAKDRN